MNTPANLQAPSVTSLARRKWHTRPAAQTDHWFSRHALSGQSIIKPERSPLLLCHRLRHPCSWCNRCEKLLRPQNGSHWKGLRPENLISSNHNLQVRNRAPSSYLLSYSSLENKIQPSSSQELHRPSHWAGLRLIMGNGKPPAIYGSTLPPCCNEGIFPGILQLNVVGT